VKIGIDCHTIGSRIGGNESYTLNLVRALTRLDARNQYRLYVTHDAAELAGLAAPHVTLVAIAPRHPVVRIAVSLPLELARHPVDVLHVQYIPPPFGRTPVVNMVHDLAHIHYPQFFARREVWRQKLLLPRAVRRAAKVLTVSRHCQEDIVRTFGIPADRVVVTHPGVNDAFHPIAREEVQATLTQYGIHSPYFLYVGNIQPRKNLTGLLDAFAIVKRRDRLPHRLVIVGKAAWLYSDVFARVRELDLARDVTFTGYVPTEHLPALYSGATALVFPSFFEGFGSPPVEAMRCGAPVIASNRPAFPEILGDAALLVNPAESAEIARAIAEIARDAELRETLIARGLERAARYRWEDTARRTLAVFEEVASRWRP
jgi:glycosyltransferase involved in cell wall biosynthesis